MAKKKAVERVPYTQEELDLILKTNVSSDLKALAARFGRSYASVRRKKWHMENKERDNAHHRAYRKEQNARYGRNCNYNIWSKSEEEFILTSKLPDIEIAEKLNRTISSIQTKRMRLVQEKGRKNAKKVRRNDKQSKV